MILVHFIKFACSREEIIKQLLLKETYLACVVLWMLRFGAWNKCFTQIISSINIPDTYNV